MDIDTIKQVKQMWLDGYTSGQIKNMTGVSDELEHAITMYCMDMDDSEILEHSYNLKDGMKSLEIKEAMQV